MIEATAIWHALADPWRDPLTRRALIEVVLLGLAGGALGCWVVLNGLAYGAESLAHGMFPGLVLAALAGAPLVLGAAGGVIVAALVVALAGRVAGVGRDTAISVVVTTLFGAGVLLALSPASPPGIQSLLFGDILGLSAGDLALAAGLAAVLAAGLWAGRHRLLAAGFDRAGAPALGVSPGVADAALLVALAATILVAVQALGNLLVVAVLVAPAATARLYARRLPALLAGAAGAAVAAGVGGLYLSYYARVAAGASVAGAMVLLYIAAAAAGRLRALR